jgi:two-component system LytT family response regulator
MIRAVIVDDEPPARRKIRRLLEQDADVESIAEAGGGVETIRIIAASDPNLVFMDVEMPQASGFELVGQMRTRGFALIFITAHAEFALQAFEVEAFDYLTKPVDPLRFQRVLQRVKEHLRLRRTADLPERLERALAAQQPKYLRRLLVEENGRSQLIPVEDLDWLESARNYVCIHVREATHIIRSTLEDMQRQLDPDRFLRINRSQIVNLDRIAEMRPWFHGEQIVVMRGGKELRWSRRYRSSLHHARD